MIGKRANTSCSNELPPPKSRGRECILTRPWKEGEATKFLGMKGSFPWNDLTQVAPSKKSPKTDCTVTTSALVNDGGEAYQRKAIDSYSP